MLDWKSWGAWFLLMYMLVMGHPQILGGSCPRCGNRMEGKGVFEWLGQVLSWSCGWRKTVCTQCDYQEVRFTITRNPEPILFQTHRVN